MPELRLMRIRVCGGRALISEIGEAVGGSDESSSTGRIADGLAAF